MFATWMPTPLTWYERYDTWAILDVIYCALLFCVCVLPFFFRCFFVQIAQLPLRYAAIRFMFNFLNNTNNRSKHKKKRNSPERERHKQKFQRAYGRAYQRTKHTRRIMAFALRLIKWFSYLKFKLHNYPSPSLKFAFRAFTMTSSMCKHIRFAHKLWSFRSFVTFTMLFSYDGENI